MTMKRKGGIWDARYLVVAIGWIAAGAARADDVVKADNTDALNLASSWVGGTVPGPFDTAVWNNTVTASNSVALGADLSWYGIRITNPGGLVTINPGNTLSLGAGGLDLSSAVQDFRLFATTVVAASQTWNIADGRTVTLDNKSSANFSSTHNLTIEGGGTIHIGEANLQNVHVLTIERGVLRTGNRAQWSTTALRINGAGQFKVASFGGSISNFTVGSGGITLTQPATGAFIPIEWLYGNSTNRRAVMNLNGDLTFVGHADNTEPAVVNVNAATGTFGDGPFLLSGARNFVIGDGGAEVDLVFKPRLGGNGSLVKQGPGTLELQGIGDNIYTGGTTVEAGTLLVTNTTGSGTGTGAVMVKGGAVLGGTGIITGATTIEDDGELAPGASVGTLTVGTLAMNDTSKLSFDLGTPWQYTGGERSSPNDLVVVDGDLSLDGRLYVSALSGFNEGIYTLFVYTGALTDKTLEVTAMPGSYMGMVEIDELSQAVNLRVIPEPTGLVSMAVVLVGLWALRRRATRP